MKHIYKNILVSAVVSTATRTTTTTSSTIDMQGFQALSVIFAVGQSADTLSGSIYWVLKLTHSDDNVTFTDVTAAELQSGAATVTINSGSLDDTVYHFAYAGNKRYVKAVATASGTHTNGTPFSVLSLRGRPGYSPVE